MHSGFIGIGNMGAPRAHNLLKAGHQLSVFDLNVAAVENLVGAGALPVDSPTAIAQGNAELIITMLPAAAHVKSVYLCANGLIASSRAGVVLIDCSTIDPNSARAVATAAAEHGKTGRA